MTTVVQLKQYMGGACIFGIVISELGYWQELCPIILFEVDKSSKVGLYGAVLPFHLAVHLRIKCGREPLLDAQKVT